MHGPVRTTATFESPFTLPGFSGSLPAGDHDLETRTSGPRGPERWKASVPVKVRLHPRGSHAGLARGLTVPLSAQEHAVARDKLTGRSLVDCFVEEMLADPMVQFIMRADRVSETEVRGIYARSRPPEPSGPEPERHKPQGQAR